jgi:hypothetical protein
MPKVCQKLIDLLHPVYRNQLSNPISSVFICVHLWFQILKKGLRARGLLTKCCERILVQSWVRKLVTNY